MKTGIFFSAAAGLMLLGSTAVFAQSASSTATGTVILKPGQTQLQSEVPAFTPSSDLGIISLKPGETVNNARAADYGSVQAGATRIEPNAGQTPG